MTRGLFPILKILAESNAESLLVLLGLFILGREGALHAHWLDINRTLDLRRSIQRAGEDDGQFLAVNFCVELEGMDGRGVHLFLWLFLITTFVALFTLGSYNWKGVIRGQAHH